MIIGVDADGVLTDMQGYNFQCGRRFLRKEIVNPAGYSIKEIYDVNPFFEILYGLKYFPKYCKECPPREKASPIIKKLMEEGNILHAITARKFVTMDTWYGRRSKKWLLDWLERHEFCFPSITFCSESNGMVDKYETCRRLSVEVMIDDRPEIVIYLAERGIPVLMMDTPYNRQVRHRNVMRVYDWENIYEEISKRSRKTSSTWINVSKGME